MRNARPCAECGSPTKKACTCIAELTCDYCGKTFTRPRSAMPGPDTLYKPERVYCSPTCHARSGHYRLVFGYKDRKDPTR